VPFSFSLPLHRSFSFSRLFVSLPCGSCRRDLPSPSRVPRQCRMHFHPRRARPRHQEGRRRRRRRRRAFTSINTLGEPETGVREEKRGTGTSGRIRRRIGIVRSLHMHRCCTCGGNNECDWDWKGPGRTRNRTRGIETFGGPLFHVLLLHREKDRDFFFHLSMIHKREFTVHRGSMVNGERRKVDREECQDFVRSEAACAFKDIRKFCFRGNL